MGPGFAGLHAAPRGSRAVGRVWGPVRQERRPDRNAGYAIGMWTAGRGTTFMARGPEPLGLRASCFRLAFEAEHAEAPGCVDAFGHSEAHAIEGDGD